MDCEGKIQMASGADRGSEGLRPFASDRSCQSEEWRTDSARVRWVVNGLLHEGSELRKAAAAIRRRFPQDNMWHPPSAAGAAVYDEAADRFFERAAELIAALPLHPDAKSSPDQSSEGGDQ